LCSSRTSIAISRTKAAGNTSLAISASARVASTFAASMSENIKPTLSGVKRKPSRTSK